MVKPAPSKTNAKPPVSLAPVKALSSAPPSATARGEPVIPEAGLTKAEPSKPVASVIPPAAAPATEAPVAKPEIAKPVAQLASAPAVKPAPVVSAAKVPAEQSKVSLIRAPATKASAAKSPVAKSSVSKSAAAKSSVDKAPVAKAPVKQAVAKAFAPKPVPAKPAAVALAASKPLAAAQVAAARGVAEQADKAAAASVDAVKAAVKSAPTPIADFATALPKPPEFAALGGAALFSQMIGFARTVGVLQASVLDHACAELKATLSEVETLARSDSAADAVALHAKAVRRSYESYAAHLKELAQVGSTALRRG